MRIGVLASPFERRDGILRHCIDLANQLAERHEVVLAGASRDDRAAEWVLAELSPRVEVAAFSYSRGMSGKLSHYLSYQGAIGRRLAELSNLQRWDVLHVHGGYALASSAFARRAPSPRIIATAHGVEADRYSARLRNRNRYGEPVDLRRQIEAVPLATGMNLLGKRAYRDVHGLISTCHFVDRVIRSRYGLAKVPGVVVPHAVHASAYRDVPAPDQASPNRVLYTGRLFLDKGLFVVLEAMKRVRAQLPDAELVIRGRGYLESKLRNEVERLGLADAVKFRTEFVSSAEWPMTYAEAPVFVMPSTYEPGISTAMLEALASGRIVVSSDFGGLGEVAADAGLRCAPVGDATALADALRDALTQRSRWQEESERARQVARAEYDWGRCAVEIEKFYAALA